MIKAQGPAPARLLLQIDGTPGHGRGRAGLGVVLRDEQGRILAWRTDAAPARTSHEAEYQALLLGLRLVSRTYPGRAVRCLTDCQLLVEHLSGRARVQAPNLQPFYTAACLLRQQIGSIEFVHITREANRLADALAWEALGGREQLVGLARRAAA